MGGESPDFYQVLELPTTCTSFEIRSAYRRLAMIWHPDKYAGNDPEGAKVRFMQIREAYEVLSDFERRFVYDAQHLSLDHKGGGFTLPTVDYGMGDFIDEMTSLMKQNRPEEFDSIENLKSTFMSMFCDNSSSSSFSIGGSVKQQDCSREQKHTRFKAGRKTRKASRVSPEDSSKRFCNSVDSPNTFDFSRSVF